ncbi:MAG: XkdX family protein [bacterium]
MFEKIKDYYDRKLWSIERIKNVVGKAITVEQYFEITGETYSA